MAMTPAGRAKLDGLRVADPQLHLPWGGRSPRHLTDAYQRFSLKPGTSSVDEFGDHTDAEVDEMYRRFSHGT